MCFASHVTRWLARAVLSSTALALSGCGSLNVQMQVLNPAVVRAFLDNELTSKLLPQILASTPESLRNQVDRLEEQHRNAYVRLAATYRSEAAKLPAEPKARLLKLTDGLVSDFDTNVKQRAFYTALRRDLVANSNDIRKLVPGQTSIAPNEAGYDKVLFALRLWQQRVAQAEKVIAEDIRSSGASLASVLPGASADAILQNSIAGPLSALQSELAQISIQNSPVAYVVASTGDESWGTRYNHVLTSSKWGASDVAIRLDSRTGNYLLKGLSFDPSDVAAVAAKVTTQALLMSAQAAGVPVKTSSTPADSTTGKALAASSGALADAQAAMETGRAQDEARRTALLSLAQTIVGEEKALAGDEASRRAAMTSIRNALDKRLTLIRPAAPSTP
jgi:hypothetical protein